MSRIYKYRLEITDLQTIEVDAYATPIHVAEQNGILYLWMEVNPDNPNKQYMKIRIVGTGNPFNRDYLEHIGSVIMNPFVWHVYWDKS